MGEGISDYTKFVIDLRRQMWMVGVEEELRRLIWQIAVTGKYISAKIHESNRKLAGFKNLYGEEQLSLDRSSDEIPRASSSSRASSGSTPRRSRTRWFSSARAGRNTS
jgi:hypothetical protein